jgi:hypothetical protein
MGQRTEPNGAGGTRTVVPVVFTTTTTRKNISNHTSPGARRSFIDVTYFVLFTASELNDRSFS